MARGTIPKVEWDTGPNTLEFGYWLDNAVSYSLPRPGTQFARSDAGTEDAWLVGIDYYLQGDVRWVPTSDDTTPEGNPITGWDGATGWRAFLEFAWARNSFEFFPDRDSATSITSYLVEPAPDFTPRLEQADATRRLRLVIRNASTSYDGY